MKTMLRFNKLLPVLLLLVITMGSSCALDDPPDPPVISQDGDLGLGSGGGKDCANQTYNGPEGGDPGWDGQAESFCRAAQGFACAGYDQELKYSCDQLRDFFELGGECPYCP